MSTDSRPLIAPPKYGSTKAYNGLSGTPGNAPGAPGASGTPSNGGSEKLEEIRLEIEDVKNVMKDNIDKAIKRGEDLDVIQQKSSDLENNAGVFLKGSRALRRQMYWKNVKMILIILLVIAIVATVLGLIIWGATKK
ncbi:vesicle-associated membrane [Yasminevirus sp. GU-2018]|uniref:Vesicle-associated membrane n=1 Tax=Yasminevirus sp. GU-2018 TaxID=2420051 RepID=A0A5K0UAE7_9VIRU|nr:vesicle-associated membrane [Yasminevirus sp. GU-2018]